MRDASSEQLENWLLALLRYAITRRDTDRMAVDALAKSMDSLGSRFDLPDFDFFARNSKRLCDAIAAGDAAGQPEFEQLLKRIEAPRLRRAFEAVLEVKREPARAQNRAWLWKGLEKPEPCASVGA
jgi:hypothetical protein